MKYAVPILVGLAMGAVVAAIGLPVALWLEGDSAIPSAIAVGLAVAAYVTYDWWPED